MVAVISVETVLLVLLVVLVAGLLRSHAEILRRLGPPAQPGEVDVPLPVTAPDRAAHGVRAAAVSGETPSGDVVKLDFDAGAVVAPTLLAFLTSGCSTCASFWETLGERRLPPGVQTVIVARGRDRERPAGLRKLAPRGIAVVMSSEAWADYRVPGAPYFVLVDGVVRGEGVATTWQALASLVADAIEDQREAERVGAGTRRSRSVDETLAAAGIGPDHPSLYPGRAEPPRPNEDQG
jgi:hypothetical protein